METTTTIAIIDIPILNLTNDNIHNINICIQ